MKTIAGALLTAVLATGVLYAQDPQWVRMWTQAQTLKPSRVGSSERIAPATERGTAFVVHGTVIGTTGKPAAGVEVFAYQTDATGIYAAAGAADPWRLKGWAVTDAEGRFEFKTIRPAPYPGRDIPAHVHLSFVTGCCGRQWSEVMFDDDPLATPQYRQRNPEVLWGKVVTHPGGAQEVRYTFTLKARGDF